MSKKLLKAASLMVVVVMVFSLIGCGSSTDAPSASTASTESSGTSTVPAEKPKVTLRIMADNVAIKSPGVQSDPVAKELESVTGVTLDWIMALGDDYYNKATAMAASGDLPDIIGVNTAKNTQLRQILFNSDAMLDLTELLKTNGQNFTSTKEMQFATNYAKKFYSNNTDKQYEVSLFVGNQTNPSNPLVGNFIRWDYYKELGYPKVESLDDFLDVMGQIQEKHPTAENGKKAYAFSLFSDWGTWPLSCSGFYDGFRGVASDLMYTDNTNYDIKPMFAADGYAWKYLQFWNRAKQRGLLDPDALTQGYGQWQAKLKAGQIYWIQPNWELATYSSEDTNKGFAPIDISGGKSESYIFNFITSQGQDGFAINKNCKYPDRAMDLLNYCASFEGTRLLINGVKGKTWDIIDGKPQYNKDVYNEGLKDANATVQKYGINLYGHLAGYAIAANDPEYNVPFQYQMCDYFVKENLKPVDIDCATHYGVTLPGQQFSKVKNNSVDTVYENALTSTTGDLKKIEDSITNYVKNNWAKVVISKNDAEFEKSKAKFIKDLDAMGYQELVKARTEEWNKNKEELNGLK